MPRNGSGARFAEPDETEGAWVTDIARLPRTARPPSTSEPTRGSLGGAFWPRAPRTTWPSTTTPAQPSPAARSGKLAPNSRSSKENSSSNPLTAGGARLEPGRFPATIAPRSMMRSHPWSRPLQALALTLASLALNRSLSAQLVTTANLENAAADNTSWLTYGRDYYAQRFVRL